MPDVDARDHEIGERVAAARRHKGLTRETLAGLSGLSVSLIKQVENGGRTLTLRTAQALAPHLGVTDLGDLFGPGEIRLTLDGRPAHPGVPDVRRALTAWHIGPGDGQAESAEYLRGAVSNAWATWHQSRMQRSDAASTLPGLITTAQRSVRLLTGEERRGALAMLAETYHLAQAFLAWHGDRELMWLTVDRAMAASLDADDELSIAGSAFYAAHLLRAVGRADDALERLGEARAMVEPHVADGGHEWAAMLADLHLCAALTRARSSDVGAWRDWELANEVVRRALPAGYVGPYTRVGSTMVQVNGVMIATELGDADDARRRAAEIAPELIPSTERRSRHLIELARAASMEGSPEGALHLLSAAADISLETVQFSPAARDLVANLIARGGRTILADAEALARRISAEP